MKFQLIDECIEESEDRVIAIKAVTAAEEYLQDHFPTFPVLPGVLMLEAMVQAARRVVVNRGGDPRVVLGEAKALRYGSFVRPGEALRVEVTFQGETEAGAYRFKGEGWVVRIQVADAGPAEEPANETAVSGRFTLRSIRRSR